MSDLIPNETVPQDNNRTYIMAVYALYALSVLTGGLAAIVGVIIAYVKRDEMRGTIYENHISYLIKTFWVGLIGGFIGWLTMIIGIGLVILLVVCIWFIYRVVAGFVKFYDGKTVSPDGWL